MKCPLTADQGDLALRYVPLARSIARRYGRRSRSWRRRRPELVSTAFLALTTAARDYREPTPVRFATFARWRIVGELGESRHDEMLSGSSPFLDRVIDHRESPPRFEAADEAESLLRRLPEKHRSALRLVFLDEMKQSEAARRLGCSEMQVSRLIAQARKLLTR